MTTPLKKTVTQEELFNAATHGLGVIASSLILIFLLFTTLKDGNFLKIIVFSVYATSLLLMYVISTLYHILAHTRAKKVFRFLDHSTVFILIAGTYTPILATIVGGFWGWFVLFVVWSVAVCGIISKIYCINNTKVSLTFYLILSWIGFLFINTIVKYIPLYGIVLLLLGGIIYTSGVFFYVQKKLRFSHAIWHVFVLVGSIFHFSTMLTFL